MLGKKCFQNDSIHFSLGNYLHILVWHFYIVIIGPKYPSHQAQVLDGDLTRVVESGQFLLPVLLMGIMLSSS